MSKKARWMVLAITFTIGSNVQSAPPETRKDDAEANLVAAWKQLEGRWLLVGITDRGKYIDHSDSERVIVITQEKVIGYTKGVRNKGTAFRLEIDLSKVPAQLNWYNHPQDATGYVVKTIYRVNNNTLEIASHRGGSGKPPKDFNVPAEPNDSIIIMEYKRLKEKK